MLTKVQIQVFVILKLILYTAEQLIFPYFLVLSFFIYAMQTNELKA